jgi:hypothetical protein
MHLTPYGAYVFIAISRRTLALVGVLALAACAGAPPAAAPPAAPNPNTLTAEERAQGWRSLFDGHSLDGWHIYHGTGTPASWRAVGGALTRVGDGGDLVTNDRFANFELALDWRVPRGGDSGIIYRIDDGGNATYMSGPELQLLDDAGHAEGKAPLTGSGSVYGIYPAVDAAPRPAGEWNSARLVVNGNDVEHWLNGTRVVQYVLGSPDWEQRVAASRFRQWPAYGRGLRGRIGLQDHGDSVAYRNIRIRELP